MRRLVATALVALAAAPAASAAPPIRVAFTAQSHTPVAGKAWWYRVKVTDRHGKPVPAKIHLQIVFNGLPVGQIGVHKVKSGVWRETIGKGGNAPFPVAARGIKLIFQAVVTAKGATVKRNWPIVVK